MPWMYDVKQRGIGRSPGLTFYNGNIWFLWFICKNDSIGISFTCFKHKTVKHNLSLTVSIQLLWYAMHMTFSKSK